MTDIAALRELVAELYGYFTGAKRHWEWHADQVVRLAQSPCSRWIGRHHEMAWEYRDAMYFYADAFTDAARELVRLEHLEAARAGQTARRNDRLVKAIRRSPEARVRGWV